MPVELSALRAYVDYLRDLGIYDLYRRPGQGPDAQLAPELPPPTPIAQKELDTIPVPQAARAPAEPLEQEEPLIARPVLPVYTPGPAVPKAARPAALQALRQQIGDCHRCPLGDAGRHSIVLGDGDPAARLFFVGEGPGADEDAQGLPFVGRAGQLLNNMISAMGLRREDVYIANIVKCRPPQNRTPEPVEAATCLQFLHQQLSIVRPAVIVALGSTAATYLLGGPKTSLAGLRGRVHAAFGAKLIVTYHPAFLLRDPRQKKEAWADLQIAMRELAGL